MGWESSPIIRATAGLRALRTAPLFKPGKTEVRRGLAASEDGARRVPSGGSEITHLVEGAVGAPALGLHHHVGMQEVGRNHVRHKRRVLVLEDHSHDVVANVSLPLQLKTGPQSFSAWQGAQGGCPPGRRGAGGKQRGTSRELLPPRKMWRETGLNIVFVFLEFCGRGEH